MPECQRASTFLVESATYENRTRPYNPVLSHKFTNAIIQTHYKMANLIFVIHTCTINMYLFDFIVNECNTIVDCVNLSEGFRFYDVHFEIYFTPLVFKSLL